MTITFKICKKNKSYGITTNQEWFDKHVKRQLAEKYPQDLADGTYKRMTIPEDINKMISEHDWSELSRGIIPLKRYVEMYKQVVIEMMKIDLSFPGEERRKILEESEELEH